jgi:hypothetical protein
MCVGHKLVDIGRRGGFGRRSQAIFYFEDTETLRKNLLDFNNDDMQVSPRRLFSRLRELKSQACNI